MVATKLSLSINETDNACNRAYYAMFNVAHAALLWSVAHINLSETRKHNSLISAFGKHLLLTGVLPQEMGKSLNKAESARTLADKTGEEIGTQQARSIVEQAERFVSAVMNKYKPVN